MNKKMLMLIGITVFLLVPILIVYGADKNVITSDIIALVESAGLHPLNPTPGDSLSLDDFSARHPRNPAPNSNIISLSGLAYYEGVYYNGGGPGGTYTPPTEVLGLMGFFYPLVIILVIGGFGLALARNRRYRMVGIV